MALRLVNFLVPSVTRCREKLLVRHREQLVDWVVHRYLHTNKFTLRTSTKHPNRVHHQAMDPSRIAICHMRATNKKEDNLKQVEQIVETAKSQQVKIVFLPECCDFVGENSRETIELAEPLTGSTVSAYCKLALSNRIWISCGGIHESVLSKDGSKTNKVYNTHILINDEGKIVAEYRKLHLFDVDTPEKSFRESKVMSAGDVLLTPVQTPVGSIGMQICYDLRFPEASLILRKRGAQILTYPSAFAVSTGKAHWEILLRARAIENQCFVIAPAQIGRHNAKRESYGHGMIVGPWGEILAQCKPTDLDVAIADIDLNNLEKVRQNMPCFEHRRNDVYTLAAISTYHVPSPVPEKFADFTIPIDTIFYRSEFSFAFTNIRCVVPGHVLVATKRNIPRLKDMTADEITDFFHTVSKIQRCLESIYGTTSSTVTVQDGADAGQTVKHVHCHIMPRKSGDFEHNDQIYIELNRHDHDKTMKRRPLEEMAAEAQRYRDYFTKAGQVN